MASDSLKPSAISAGLLNPAGSSPAGVRSGAVLPTSKPDAQNPSTSPTGEGGEKLRISKAAYELLRQSELMADARNTLDQGAQLRQDRVAEVRARLEAGVYDTKGVKDELAQRLASILGDLPYQGQSNGSK